MILMEAETENTTEVKIGLEKKKCFSGNNTKFM